MATCPATAVTGGMRKRAWAQFGVGRQGWHRTETPRLDLKNVPLRSPNLDCSAGVSHSNAFANTASPICRWGLRLLFSVGLMIAGTLIVRPHGGKVAAAPPRHGRFVDRFFSSRPEPKPQLIAVPVPMPASEAEREAAGRLQVQVSTADDEQQQAAANRVEPANLPDWATVVRFGKAAEAVGRHVVKTAIDSSYKPAEEPLYEPILVATAAQKDQAGAGGLKPKENVTEARQASRKKTLGANPFASKKPIGPAPPKSARLDRLRVRIAQTLATYQRRPLNTSQHSPWEIMHGFVSFGIPTQIRAGGPRGELVNAIGWMNSGGRCRGQVMLTVRDGRPHALYGVGLQGHSGQYLAILAQCRVSAKSPLLLGEQEFTVADLIEAEKLNCRAGTELTFALIGLAHYLPTDATWRSRDGEAWSLERLMQEELRQPIRTAPCGGTHRLFGLAYGCQRRLKATGELDGVYERADRYVRDYQNLTLRRLQNRDGSFSTEWFKYPADRDDDIDRKIQTTGHILEWLVASVDQEMLYEHRIITAAEFLAVSLAREANRDWKNGPLGHALHALSIYQERVWGVVLPGNVVAFTGPMKAATALVANRADDTSRRAEKPDAALTR